MKPPKTFSESLPHRVQFARVGLLEKTLNIPPPLNAPSEAALLVNVHPVRAGLLRKRLYIPPPRSAELPVNIQLVRVGLLSS